MYIVGILIVIKTSYLRRGVLMLFLRSPTGSAQHGNLFPRARSVIRYIFSDYMNYVMNRNVTFDYREEIKIR